MNDTKTIHEIIIGNAQNAVAIADQSVDLIVTSPPYPMIEMWDEIMASLNPKIKDALVSGQAKIAFELMHAELDKVWEDVNRVLKPGGIACINIGDATRTINGDFSLHPNHSRIITKFLSLGFNNLPNIIWRKQTNAPNKFMGSGMLPAGAYVTLEHEWILIFRKGGKRLFQSEIDKSKRRSSSFFWEERNSWFSDLWEFKGVRQFLGNTESRDRSAAFPFELPYRLINMYSLKGDVVYDPFLGTGTTTIAALASERNSKGIEIDTNLNSLICGRIEGLYIEKLNSIVSERLKQHEVFIGEYKKEIKHFNNSLKMSVITSQETDMSFSYVTTIEKKLHNMYEVKYTAAQTIADIIPLLPKYKKQATLGF